MFSVCGCAVRREGSIKATDRTTTITACVAASWMWLVHEPVLHWYVLLLAHCDALHALRACSLSACIPFFLSLVFECQLILQRVTRSKCFCVLPDPNDIIVRAVPNAPGVASFIDEQWTTFVAEFNVRARAIQKQMLADTAKPLLKFLQV